MLVNCGAVLGCRRCLGRHLKLTNLALRKTTVRAVRTALRWLRWFRLRNMLRWLGLGLGLGLGLVRARWLAMWPVEIHASRRRWNLALRLEQS